ncbi:hypothetical protein C8J57DRAFT_267307 [Mycena rebaudengoi]|nr:hypothetical protein C8J57DRAFT_267307 [Mycena rebaudengoi]
MPSLLVMSLLAFTAVSGVFASPHTASVPRLLLNRSPDCKLAEGFEMCRESMVLRVAPAPSSREHIPSSLTNGQRLARHLPLKPPTRRSSARRAEVSPSVNTPVSRGYIQVFSVDANDNPTGVLGYVSKNTYIHAQYAFHPSRDDALLVGLSGDHDLRTLNSDTGSPAFLGLVQGRDNTPSGIAKGSSNYLYLASTEQTAPNATPQTVGSSYTTVHGNVHPAESAVWSIDPATNVLIAQWINSDGSPTLTIPFAQGANIYFSGDPDAFQQMYPAALQRIKFVYIPA